MNKFVKAILLTFCFYVLGFSGMFLPSLSSWLAWPAQTLMTYMLDLVTLFSRVPNALVERSLSLVFMIVIYAIFIGTCLILWQKTKARQSPLRDEII